MCVRALAIVTAAAAAAELVLNCCTAVGSAVVGWNRQSAACLPACLSGAAVIAAVAMLAAVAIVALLSQPQAMHMASSAVSEGKTRLLARSRAVALLNRVVAMPLPHLNVSSINSRNTTRL